jgi:hypothetical protein
MTDVFEEWKKRRFIIANPELVDGDKLVILTDFHYWIDNRDQLAEWCKFRNVDQQGSTVVFSDEATLLEFVLRWS